MHLYPNGIKITQSEYRCLLYVESDPGQWLQDLLVEKARRRKEALINEWRPRLFADPDVVELPADVDALAQLIMARPDYKSRIQADAELDPSVAPTRRNIDIFNGIIGRGARVPGNATEVLCTRGLNLPDVDGECILAYVQDLDDWILGALLGHINRGRKKMITKYEPIIQADPSVTTMPATEDGLINMIVARSDYQRLGG